MLNTGNRWQRSLVRSLTVSTMAALFFSASAFSVDRESEKKEIQMSVRVPVMPVPKNAPGSIKKHPFSGNFCFSGRATLV